MEAKSVQDTSQYLGAKLVCVHGGENTLGEINPAPHGNFLVDRVGRTQAQAEEPITVVHSDRERKVVVYLAVSNQANFFPAFLPAAHSSPLIDGKYELSKRKEWTSEFLQGSAKFIATTVVLRLENGSVQTGLGKVVFSFETHRHTREPRHTTKCCLLLVQACTED